MIFKPKKDLKVNARLRKELSRPFGVVLSTRQLQRHLKIRKKIYAIGDFTLSELLKSGYVPSVGIFDFRTERKAVYFPIIKKAYKNQIKVNNRRGVLSKQLWDAVRGSSASAGPCGIKVRGEEDLASLACIHFARNGDYVIYGLRDRGMAVIKVDGKIKRYVLRILKEMS